MLNQKTSLRLPRFIYLFTATGILLILGGRFTATLFAQQDEFPGERVVHLLQEPRHRTVHHQDNLYLLDVQVNPGDTSLPHTHNQAIMYTFISAGDGPRGGSVKSRIDYLTKPLTHKISNPGPGLFRIFAMVNAGQGNQDLKADRPIGLAIEPQVENPWFRSYRIELSPGEEIPLQTHKLPSVVIQVADGVIHVSRNDGVTAELNAISDWVWHEANEPFKIRNIGSAATSIVINEGR